MRFRGLSDAIGAFTLAAYGERLTADLRMQSHTVVVLAPPMWYL